MRLRTPFIRFRDNYWIVYEFEPRKDHISVSLNCYVVGSDLRISEGGNNSNFDWDEKDREAFFEVMEHLFGLLRGVRR